MTPSRIVSLLPSATEIICGLGGESALVGISHECDFPEHIRDRRVLTRSRIDSEGSSGDIDRAVRAAIAEALSIYAVDDRTLAELAPDLVVTQDLCEVCAVSLDDVRAAVARLARRDDVQVLSLRPTRLEHVLSDIERIANAMGVAERGTALRSALQTRLGHIAERAARAGSRPRVVSLEWMDPLMVGGTWMPELIELAGGCALGAVAGELARTVTETELSEFDADVIVIKPCGFSMPRTLQERPLIETRIVPNARHARVFVTDGNAFFNRPGPRLVESVEILAACIHPALFPDLRDEHREVIAEI